MKLIVLILPTLSSSFVLPLRGRDQTLPLFAEENSDKDEGLVLDGLDKEMNQYRSEFAFSEADFLAAARKRAEERKESSNSGASDKDWQAMADEKAEQFGQIDDWDNSMKEAGNADSQILMFTDPPADGEDEDGGSDPKLLLF